jgi:hypothetical protein
MLDVLEKLEHEPPVDSRLFLAHCYARAWKVRPPAVMDRIDNLREEECYFWRGKSAVVDKQVFRPGSSHTRGTENL